MIKVRNLRIIVAVVSVTACALLVALSVRTKCAIDGFYGPLSKSHYFCVMSRHGGIGLLLGGGNLVWSYRNYPADKFGDSEIDAEIGYKTALGLYSICRVPAIQNSRSILASDFASAVFAAIPWLRWRFSIRTLLIAMTLMAVSLGIICAAR